jgi:hypothetical protein
VAFRFCLLQHNLPSEYRETCENPFEFVPSTHSAEEGRLAKKHALACSFARRKSRFWKIGSLQQGTDGSRIRFAVP